MRSDGWFVCLSVTLYLDSQVSVCLKNDTIYQMCNEGQRFFFGNDLFLFYVVICISWQHVHCYFVFVKTEASLLVSKANDIIFNPQHACTARVTVLGLCVCLLLDISL